MSLAETPLLGLRPTFKGVKRSIGWAMKAYIVTMVAASGLLLPFELAKEIDEYRSASRLVIPDNLSVIDVALKVSKIAVPQWVDPENFGEAY